MYQVIMFIQCAGIAILALEIMVILFQHPSRIQRDMIFLLVSLLVVFVAYSMEMQCRSAAEAMLAIKFGYLGKPFIAVSMLFLILDYFRIRLPRWLTTLLVLIRAVVTLSVFTTEAHKLYYVSSAFVECGLFPHVESVHGPVYYVYMVSMFLYCAAMLIACFVQLRKKHGSVRERHQTWLFIAAIFVPMASLGVYLTHVFQEYDCTLPAYLISVVVFLISFFRPDLFDAITLAKEQAVDYIHCGMLVYDDQEKLICQNDLAKQMDMRGKAAELAKSGEPYDFEGRLYAVEDREIRRDGLEHNAVYGDRSRLSQALMNIVSNAVKYTPPGGTIWLSASETTALG